jgi:hypothetical protein
MSSRETVLDLPTPDLAAYPAQTVMQTAAFPKPFQVILTRLIDLCVAALLLFLPAYFCLHSTAILDTDIWWHLRVGEWISLHHAIPRTELFSASMAGTPWAAYSWLFELLNFELFRRLGAPGLLVYTAGLLLLITAAVFTMVRRNHQQLPAAALLTFICMFTMGHLYTPRPWLFSMLFFTLELDILMRVRRSGSSRPLLWLPLVFGLWANIHIQFVYGLFILGVAMVESLAKRRWKNLPTLAAAGPLVATLICSLVATLATPYGAGIYFVVHGYATQSGALNSISELQAIPFRDLIHYSALLFALLSAAFLGRKRRWLSFEGALLLFAAFVSFRSQRDAWVVAIVGAAILADALPRITAPNFRPAKYLLPAAAAIAVCLLAIAFRSPELSASKLRERQTAQLPVGAVYFIRAHGYSGPLFNDFNWGGYLIWNLRMPVSIDGRQNVYGDQRIDRSIATWGGAPDWHSDPELQSAGLVVGPNNAPLTQLLRTDPHFQLAYHDKVAAVFVARR